MGFGLLPEFGFIALLAAAVLSVLQGILPWAGLISGRGELIVAARPLAVGACILFFAALGCLAISLATNDFSVAYVAQHSNSRLPVFFKVAAAWGGHEGSMLFFVFTLSLWGASVSGVLSSGSWETAARPAPRRDGCRLHADPGRGHRDARRPCGL